MWTGIACSRACAMWKLLSGYRTQSATSLERATHSLQRHVFLDFEAQAKQTLTKSRKRFLRSRMSSTPRVPLPSSSKTANRFSILSRVSFSTNPILMSINFINSSLSIEPP